jgi:hypothetical protein
MNSQISQNKVRNKKPICSMEEVKRRVGTFEESVFHAVYI